MHLFLKIQALKKPPWPSHSCFILKSATTDGFLIHSKFDNNFFQSSPEKESFLTSEAFFCVCSELFSEIFQFQLCSRFMTYVLPSLLVITLNSSSLVSTLLLEKKPPPQPPCRVFHLMQYMAARTRQKGSLPPCCPNTPFLIEQEIT